MYDVRLGLWIDFIIGLNEVNVYIYRATAQVQLRSIKVNEINL